MCLPKPAELVALHDEMLTLFHLIRRAFNVGDQHALVIDSVDRVCSEDDEVATTAALALHYTQSMRVLARPDRRVRITGIVNTSACLHTVLSILADECEHREIADRIWQTREQIGVAATTVASVDLAHGGENSYMR